MGEERGRGRSDAPLKRKRNLLANGADQKKSKGGRKNSTVFLLFPTGEIRRGKRNVNRVRTYQVGGGKKKRTRLYPQKKGRGGAESRRFSTEGSRSRKKKTGKGVEDAAPLL